MNKEKTVHVLALHTVSESDGLGGTISHHRGEVFQLDEGLLERLKRHGAARLATSAEVAESKKSGVVSDLADPVVSGRSYSQVEAASARVAPVGDVAIPNDSRVETTGDDLGLDDVGGDGKTTTNAAATKTAGKTTTKAKAK